MTSAVIYARVSSARQKKNETIGSQIAALRAHADHLGLEVPEEWIFADDGHSGATLVRPALERLRDLVAGVGIGVVLCYSPDRLARKFAYQALLIEEFTRAGTRVEFVNGTRGDSPEDQLLVQFQGMFAEYEKAQIMERYRRGKTHRAKTGSVNVLSGAPYGYRYVRRNDHSGAVYEIVEHEAALVAELFRRYADDGASLAELTRWLTDDPATPTRTGKQRWDRSTVWGMLRNPAYAGRAVFGKTMVVHESPSLNRAARLAGRETPKASKTVDRPREDRTEIPVPAIVTDETFERVAQRLAENKRFASRNSKDPSLLQGLAACAGCGYGYYRTSTRTTNKKIYYYRCLGSDAWRYEGGRVCANKPVRADYLDTVVWDHITALMADPQLIRTEIDKRLETAKTSDPVAAQRKRLDTALAKARSGIAAMIEAFGEQLITIDELRARMPDLRARETNLRNQIDALDAQLADRDAYLALAADLHGFLAQLNTHAETATVDERRRVLKLLVKDVLIGPEKITIRHRIPIRERTGDGTPQTGNTDQEGEHCQLRWRRNQSATAEHCPARAGTRGGSSIRGVRQCCRVDANRLAGGHQVCRRSRRAPPHPAAGRAGQSAACRVAGTQGVGLQRGQDRDRVCGRVRVRLLGFQCPPLSRQVADQTIESRSPANTGTAAHRDPRTARLQCTGGHRHAHPDHQGLGGLLPGRGVEADVQRSRRLSVGADLQVGDLQPPHQVEMVGLGPLLRQVQQVQEQPLGIRRRSQRHAPATVLLDRHRPAHFGQGPGITR
ncbi:Resolvase, N terminal domain [Nocardia africana]|uniref:Resolvase, N terminal domain n=1 Tax=Nocardia africana TaxID=134964 RepID=A0A378X748_9NOCA|nr:Resolvase, N terminal domain [Nocardia africana]